MGRQSNDATVRCSSIALLQERFRQLQRIKEMREEKRILRMIAEAERPKWFFCPDLAHPSGPPCGSSSLQAEYHANCAEIQSFKTSLSLCLRSSDVSMHASKMSNETEVDTSLHL
ncbi:hypothetical protein MUK42_30500 [Musa troglodytarum]|uniref:Uncharacterized protein n=1 Tax=Musa troglodytarum TaxID=320322 RepID=A0A9E7FPI0_9LILI|nr:hypothetical protein MUK42_30500 [Musa troglodytarum]